MAWPVLEGVRTPYFVIDEERLAHNLSILDRVQKESGAKIILAQKAFSNFALYPQIGKVLAGTTASGVYEARLGKTYMPQGETHIFSPAYQKEDFDEILSFVDYLSFNSFRQWKAFAPLAKAKGKSCGIRVNPNHSTQDGGIYDPAGPGSRLGVLREAFQEDVAQDIDGLHFHTLCEQGLPPLLETLEAFEAQFGSFLKDMRWLNLGGGHHITREDYDVDGLIELVRRLRREYEVEVYLEPGEAVVLNAGYLVASVVDIVYNELPIAILDTSAACHMPDVLEVPYTPPLQGALGGEAGPVTRLGGPTCLAGDIIGDYHFPQGLEIGDKLVFEDMALYTMVKTNTFNGTPLPSIWRGREGKPVQLLRSFDYWDFHSRL